ncbi:MAG: SUMF1/EgtB/PvdO family nonheme iron enzyme [Prevotella sp.]|nr:formylglycine-generating enzyme family protein [Prevotella sp.]MDD7605311.1 SUMF1/EgtB/PvdO family nonheme iron enzyme [Prevotellaceae bacterium]MDY3246960.1 SUMF1/EgtB/PvdO family nonheme iron enzyme [Prevotella sp.]
MTFIRTSLVILGLAIATTTMGQGIIRHNAPAPKATVKKPATTAASPAKQRAVAQLVKNMVYVQGGTFTMGRTSSKAYWNDSGDKPAHQVTVGSFYICKYEVTQQLWKAFMGTNPSWTKADNMPVEWVNWVTAQKFIQKLNAYSGKRFRLPTEAEWEFAARGGTRSHNYLYSGSDDINEVAWWHDNSGGKLHAVGTKHPNELGLYDMTGNAYEWCSDWQAPYQSSAQTNPKGPQSGRGRVKRGGNCNSSDSETGVMTRSQSLPDIATCCGIRLVCDRL